MCGTLLIVGEIDRCCTPVAFVGRVSVVETLLHLVAHKHPIGLITAASHCVHGQKSETKIVVFLSRPLFGGRHRYLRSLSGFARMPRLHCHGGWRCFGRRCRNSRVCGGFRRNCSGLSKAVSWLSHCSRPMSCGLHLTGCWWLCRQIHRFRFFLHYSGHGVWLYDRRFFRCRLIIDQSRSSQQQDGGGSGQPAVKGRAHRWHRSRKPPFNLLPRISRRRLFVVGKSLTQFLGPIFLFHLFVLFMYSLILRASWRLALSSCEAEVPSLMFSCRAISW